MALDAGDGSLRWDVDLRDGVTGRPVPVGDHLLVASADPREYEE